MLSFWEKQSFVNYDYAIIGSGIVGLSTAISIKEKQPDASVVVFESGLLPTGASTKNAGFACFGSISELLEDVKTLGKEEALKLVKERYAGLLKLRERLGDEKIGYHNHGGYELIRTEELYCLDEIESINNMLGDIFDEKPFEENASLVKQFGFNTNVVKSMIYSRYEGQIDTGMMMKSLINMAMGMGINILTGARVDHFEENGAGVEVIIHDKTHGRVNFSTKSLAVCTNAFTKQLIPSINLHPGRGIVLVTKPIENLKFKGVFHVEQGYYYFRNYGKRVIFGGGRNLDYEGEQTTKFEINEVILAQLEKQLREVILPDTPYRIEHTWAGIMAFGPNKQPILTQHSDHVYLGVRLGGMGVAIGSRMGEKLAEMMV